MKKVLLILVILLIGINVNAADGSFSLILNGEDSITDEYTLDLSIDSENALCGLTMDMSFDSDKLELKGYEGKSGFSTTLGNNRIVLDTDNCKKVLVFCI